MYKSDQNKRLSQRLLSAKEASEYLGINVKTLWAWISRGLIPQVKLPGAKPKYDIRDIERIIEKHKSYSDISEVGNNIFQSNK